ncbi:hypothetical protein [Rubrivivax gelatinosus]|uniref:hypothetical protein n=1 Tax=Rubrivivax gelatinosus TaxID=28068 RepID=UPI001ED8C5A8|nr:hypothetical protein [Rubrivivax gelatinosus]
MPSASRRRPRTPKPARAPKPRELICRSWAKLLRLQRLAEVDHRPGPAQILGADDADRIRRVEGAALGHRAGDDDGLGFGLGLRRQRPGAERGQRRQGNASARRAAVEGGRQAAGVDHGAGARQSGCPIRPGRRRQAQPK